MFFARFYLPRRSFLRSRLLLSTALIGVAALMLPNGARAQEWETDPSFLYFDNTQDNPDSGDDVVLAPVTGVISRNADVWRQRVIVPSGDPEVPDGTTWASTESISSGETGILSATDADGVVNPNPVVLDLQNSSQELELDGLRLDAGNFTFQNGGTQAGGSNALVLDNNSGDSDSALTIGLRVESDLVIDGTGPDTGAVIYTGNMFENSSRVSTITVNDGARFEIVNVTEGDLINNGLTVLREEEGVTAYDFGVWHNGELTNDGVLRVDGAAFVNKLTNNINGIVDVGTGSELRIGNDGELTNDGLLRVDGAAFVNNITNNINGIVDVGAGGELKIGNDARFANSGELKLGGVIRTTNTPFYQGGTLALSDDDGRGNAVAAVGTLYNYGTVSVAAGDTVELNVIGRGSDPANEADGIFVNGTGGKFDLEPGSNLTVNASEFQLSFNSDIAVTNHLTLNGDITNNGKLTYRSDGADEDNDGIEDRATINGRLDNESGLDANNVQRVAELNIEGQVDAQGNEISNDGTLNVGARADAGGTGAQTGDIINIGRLENWRNVNVVGAGSRLIVSSADPDSDGGSVFDNKVDGIVTVDSGGTLEADKYQNSGKTTIGLDGALISDRFTNRDNEHHDDAVLIVDGGSIDAGEFVNESLVNINVTDAGARGTVDGDSIRNLHEINVAGDLTSGGTIANIAGGNINVEGAGLVDAALLVNRGIVNINVTGTGTGGTVDGDSINNHHEINVAGKLTSGGTIANVAGGNINVEGAGLVDAALLVNRGIVNINVTGTGTGGTVDGDSINNRGEINVAGNLTSAGTIKNFSGGSIEVEGGGQVDAANLTNEGSLYIQEGGDGTDGIVAGDIVTNKNLIEVRGNLTPVTSLTNDAIGKIDVFSGGLVKTATITNNTGRGGDTENGLNIHAAATVNATSVFDNNASGRVNVNGGTLQGKSIENAGLLDVMFVGGSAGIVKTGVTFANNQGGVVNLDGGILQVVDADGTWGNLTNSGRIFINATDQYQGEVKVGAVESDHLIAVDGGELTAAVSVTNNATGIVRVRDGGHLKTGTFINNESATLNVLQGHLELVNADGVLGTLTNSGLLNVNVSGGEGDKITVGDVANTGGTVNVNGTLSADTKFVNDGGTVNVAGLLDAGTSFQNIGDLIDGVYDASVKLTGGTVEADALTNDGLLHGRGTLRGELTNNGKINLNQSELIASTVTNQAEGVFNFAGQAYGADGVRLKISNAGLMNLTETTVTGDIDNSNTLNASGSISGQLTNTGTMKLTETMVTGGVDNSNTLTASGSISGLLTNTGTMNVAEGKTLALTSVSEQFTNQGDLNVEGRLRTQMRLVNSHAGNLDVLAGGAIEGDVFNQGAMTLASNGEVNGNVRNGGTLNANGTVTGTLTQGQYGTLNVTDALSVGSMTNEGETNLSGTLTATDMVTNRVGGVINLDGATIQTASGVQRAEGDVLQNFGTVDVQSNSTTPTISTINGGFTNHGLINMTSVGATAELKVNGQFTNNSEIRVDGANSDLTIRAHTIALTEGSIIELSQVTLIGNVLNSVSLAYDQDTTLQGSLVNEMNGDVQVRATVDGNNNSIENDGTISIGANGNVSNLQDLINHSGGDTTIAAGGQISAENVVNEAGANMVVDGALAANATGGISNQGILDVSGTLIGGLTNTGGTVTLADATIDGDVQNEGTETSVGTLSGSVNIDGDLENTSNATATLAGSVQGVVNAGNLSTAGDLAVSSLTNLGAGLVEVHADHRLDAQQPIANLGRIEVAGTLGAAPDTLGVYLANGETATLQMSGGVVDLDVNNDGMVRGQGTITGNLTQTAGAELDVEGNLATGGLANMAGADVTVTEGNTLSTTTSADNRGTMTVGGRFVGDILNTGIYNLTGTHDGSLTSNGASTIGGIITGDLIYQGPGRVTDADGDIIGLNFDAGADIRGVFDLATNYAVESGDTVNAATTRVRQGVALTFDGAVGGDLGTGGEPGAEVGPIISGNLINNGRISLSEGENAQTGDVLTVGGGVSGSGVYALDINLSEMTSDSVDIQGGPATGHFDIALNYLGGAGVTDIGRSTTLIDVASEFGAQNDFTFKVLNPRTIADEKVVYLVGRDPVSGNVDMASTANPNVGAIFGNVALTRSLIGAVVNRPTSPFVTGLAFDATDNPCGVGSWGRATGGTATVSGGTNNGSITVDSSVDATYYGMQAGTDFACFDDRFAGWSMSFGGFLGVNQGDTTQLFYGIDSGTGETIPDRATSVFDTEFDQIYAGVYVTGTKGPFQVDLQYRHENTDFATTSTALVSGAGLDLKEDEFSSKGNTLSGSLSYTRPIGDKGWTVVPSVGFSHTRTETDTITFDDGDQLEFEDSETTIGFVSATIAKSFVQTESNSAVYAFATGTIYKDFADPSVSILSDPSDADFEPQRLTTDNLGTYGEISIGANYVKVLQPGPGLRPRQLSASARIDARNGGDLDSVGVTGQIRLQF